MKQSQHQMAFDFGMAAEPEAQPKAVTSDSASESSAKDNDSQETAARDAARRAGLGVRVKSLKNGAKDAARTETPVSAPVIQLTLRNEAPPLPQPELFPAHMIETLPAPAPSEEPTPELDKLEPGPAPKPRFIQTEIPHDPIAAEPPFDYITGHNYMEDPRPGPIPEPLPVPEPEPLPEPDPLPEPEPDPQPIPEPAPMAVVDETSSVAVVDEPSPVVLVDEPDLVAVVNEPTPVAVVEEYASIPRATQTSLIPPPPNPAKTPRKTSKAATADKPKSKRGRKSLKQIAAEADLIEVPSDELLFSKQYYSMGEVSEMFKVNQSLLRFWESEFTILQPKKNKKGDRHFRPVDIKNLHLIYHLLRQRKYTIEGAKEFLKGNKKADQRFEAIQRLQDIKNFLLELKAQL